MPENNTNIELRSDEVQEIMSHVPNWMIRWGISLIFGLIILLLFLSWFIKYPDVVEGQLVLTTNQPPSRLVSQSNGYIENLKFSNETTVSKGDVIAEIRNPIQKSSVDSLVYLINQTPTPRTISDLQNLQNTGILQSEINSLIKALIEFQNHINNIYYEQNLGNLSRQITYNNHLALVSQQELDLLKTEIKNAKEKFDADSLLYVQKVIAKHAFYKNQSEYFSKRQQLINAKKANIQYQINASNYEKQKIDLKKDYEDRERQLTTAISATKKAIESTIANWQQSYVLKAPIDGKLAYLENLSEQQYVESQQTLFAIIPKEESIIGIITLSNQALGKLAIGQKVRMKLDNYPHQEFGQLIGEVLEISKVSSEKGYFAKVNLTMGLTTSYQKEIQYKPEMSGTAEVITKDLRLIERIFNQFRKVLDQ